MNLVILADEKILPALQSKYIFLMNEELDQLKRFKGKSGYHVLKTDDYSITGFIADLVHHAKQTENEQLLAEFDELCTVMETGQGRSHHINRN